MSPLAAVSVYVLSCAPGVGLLAFTTVNLFDGTFQGTLGVSGLLAIFGGSIALITSGLFIGTSIWIGFDASRPHRPQLLKEFVGVFDVVSLLQSLTNHPFPARSERGDDQAAR
jgi:hypothetical protein